MKTLDVGCGIRPRGTMNIDLEIQHVPNFQQIDASANLPFPDNSFDIVISSHLIEHLPDPVRFIKELMRVSRRKVVIYCPHRLSKSAKGHGHLWSFDGKWFWRVLKNVPHKVTYSYVNRKPFRLLLPDEIKVEIWKVET